MNSVGVGLILVCVLWSSVGPAGAAESSCLATAATSLVSKNPVAARQLEMMCKKVGLEPAPAGNSSLLQVMKLAFGDTVKPRGDRLKPAAPAGMPTGPVMPKDGVVELDANEVGSEGLVALDIEGPQLSVRLRPVPASGIAQVQASQMRQGTQYRWVLTTRRQTYDGSFSLPDDETMKRTEARLRALTELSAAPATLLFLEAAIYDEEELFASRDRVIAALRRELQK